MAREDYCSASSISRFTHWLSLDDLEAEAAASPDSLGRDVVKAIVAFRCRRRDAQDRLVESIVRTLLCEDCRYCSRFILPDISATVTEHFMRPFPLLSDLLRPELWYRLGCSPHSGCLGWTMDFTAPQLQAVADAWLDVPRKLTTRTSLDLPTHASGYP